MADEIEPKEAEAESPSKPALESGTYEIIRKRLQEHAKELKGCLGRLDGLRKETFGSVESALLHADRITTRHNCVPRDMVPLDSSHFLFGYNVQFGLKTSIQLGDVFAIYHYDGEHFKEQELELINHPQFIQDFQSLYKYYKHTVFAKFSFIGPFLFMVFRVGKDVSDVKTFKWAFQDGKLAYIDNRSDHEFKFPPQYEFNWKRTYRELHRSGVHPHISIDDRVFVECIGGDLTIKVEDNTESGEGIYSEPVEFKDQTLDDAEIYFAICGNLILLKIKPFQEKQHRYFVYNDKLRQVQRVDGISQACVMLPEDQGIIFSNGYYLQTGVLKLFESDRINMLFERVVTSTNGEDYLYVFYNRTEGDYVLMSYNLISQAVDNPIWCNGFSLFENGRLVYFRCHEEAQKHHTLQVWQTPFVSAGLEQHQNTDSFLYKIGNRDVVRCMAECQDILNLLGKDENYSDLYSDIARLSGDIVESYFWIDQVENCNLRGVLEAIKDAAGKAVDEHQKVIRIRRETGTELQRVRSKAKELFAKLEREKPKSIDAFVHNLASLRGLRGETISLKDLRYIDLKEVESLEARIAESNKALSAGCVQFLLNPESLNPYRKQVEEHQSVIPGIKKVSEAKELEKQILQTGADLELLIDITTNLQIDDPTETTRIIDNITSIYTTLNQVKGALKNRIRDLARTEGAAQFSAELKLLNQSVINYLDICDSPARCDEYLNKIMVQFEELEGRFADFDEYVVQLADKRTEVHEAFEARKLALMEARNRKAGALMASAERILKVIRNRVEAMKSINDINGYMASDLMVEKIRGIVEQLIGLEESVKADDIQGRLKSIQQDGVRQLKDRLELFADGDNVISLGQHRFLINVQPLDLTIVQRDDDMTLHLTGTRFFEPVRDEAFLATREVWSQEIVSENAQVYRSEFLAHQMLAWLMEHDELSPQSFAQLKPDEQLAQVQQFMGPRYAEGYTKGIHDQDALAILQRLIAVRDALGLARHSPDARACASVYWHRFCPKEIKTLWSAKLKGVGLKNKFFPDSPVNARHIDQLRVLVSSFISDTRLFHESLAEEAGEYLFHQLVSDREFVISREAAALHDQFNEHLLEYHCQEDFDGARKKVSGDPGSEFELIKDWLRGFLSTADREDHEEFLNETAALFFCDSFDPRCVVDAERKAVLEGLRGTHSRIQEGKLTLDYVGFMQQLDRFSKVSVPKFNQYQSLKKSVIESARQEMRLDEFEPRVLTSFVRNRLIDTVYLPMTGDNLAKQIGAAGDKKRTDLMGLLLLISPPGYGKTTLMEYIANRLGIVFMKINGPALGHQVTSLDPEDAPNAAAREEIKKLNLAFEMGDNVMIYLDDIQHCNPELLQKFISLCDAQRKVEGVYRGRPRTYDLRGRKVVVVMAGNPYTESGEKFKIPDMLANRADTYNLGDILGGHEEAFKMSYLENAITSNPVLQQLANKSQKDIQKFIGIAESGSRTAVDFEATYSVEETNEIIDVLKKMLRVRDAVLKVNQEYIHSAAQADAYRTEPAFKLQGSYRNMNRMAEKVLPVMNDEEVQALIVDHYENEAQTLTTGTEANLLKFRELMNLQSPEDLSRWSDIKKTFRRHQLTGNVDESDPVSRVVGQLSAFSEGLGGIRDTIEAALSKQGETRIELPEMKPEIHIDMQPLAQQVSYFSSGLDAIRELLNRQSTQGSAPADTARRDDLNAIGKRIDSVNQDLDQIRALIEQYHDEQKASREASEKEIETRSLDLSGISVTRTTLSQIYKLIDQDEKANEKKKIKLPKKPDSDSKPER